jgi:hypothetical protein
MINWKFIEGLEGRRYVGYVPDPKTSKSGVTIGVGVDIGHLTDLEFNSLPVALQNKIEPYRHLVGRAALQKLHSSPLMLGTDDVDVLDGILQRETIGEVAGDYDHIAGVGSFDALSDEQQTVIVSVAFQYGVLAAKCPRFWTAVVSKNWEAAIHELENFGDAYESRHIQEANLLKGGTT